MLPIGRGFDFVLAQPAFVNEMPAQGFGGRCLRGDPGIAVAGRKTQVRDRLSQKRDISAFPCSTGARSMEPHGIHAGARLETLLLASVSDFDNDKRVSA